MSRWPCTLCAKGIAFNMCLKRVLKKSDCLGAVCTRHIILCTVHSSRGITTDPTHPAMWGQRIKWALCHWKKALGPRDVAGAGGPYGVFYRGGGRIWSYATVDSCHRDREPVWLTAWFCYWRGWQVPLFRIYIECWCQCWCSCNSLELK